MFCFSFFLKKVGGGVERLTEVGKKVLREMQCVIFLTVAQTTLAKGIKKKAYMIVCIKILEIFHVNFFFKDDEK